VPGKEEEKGAADGPKNRLEHWFPMEDPDDDGDDEDDEDGDEDGDALA
jgi:hypothetical protein